MGRLILITGGARSGKSHFAEKQLWDKKKVCYIATGVSPENDPEWEERVRLHRERRPVSWETREQYNAVGTWMEKQEYAYYLLDCATMLTTNVLFQAVEQYFPDKLALSDHDFLSKAEQNLVSQKIVTEWQEILRAYKCMESTLYIVTNEVGLGIVPDNRLGRYFRDVLGQVNQMLAKEASEVYLVICGLAQRLK